MVPMQGGDGNNWWKKIDEWFTIRQIRQFFPPPIFSHARYVAYRILSLVSQMRMYSLPVMWNLV